MPKRTDISSILIIGAGPIVIGQACEFDYSGTQACKALKAEGYRVVLVNSNPATIMTDPDLADATYIEPITPEIVAKIIEKERPDALLPTMGGQTALNTALSLRRMGVLDKFNVKMIGATADAIDKAEDRELLPRGDDADRARDAALAAGQDAARRARGARGYRAAGDHPAVVHARRHRRRHRLQQGRVHRDRRARHRRLADQRGADRGIGARLEGIRDGGRSRQERQLHHHLLDREPRPDGRAHRRLDHDRAGAHAHRQGIPDHARRLDRGVARDRGRDRRLERAVRGQSGGRAPGHHRDEPAGVALLGAGLEGDRLPDRQGRGQARGRLHARRDRQRHHRRRDAGELRADHRLRRHQDPALRVREISRRRPGADHVDEIGRRGDGDRPHLPGEPAEGAALARDRADRARRGDHRGRRPRRRPQRDPRRARHPDARPPAAGGAGHAARHVGPAHPRRLQDRSLVPRRDQRHRRDGSRDQGQGPADQPGHAAPPQGHGVLRRAARGAHRARRGGGHGGAARARGAAGVQAHRHLRGGVRLAHRLHVFDLRDAVRRAAGRRGGALRQEEGRDPRRRAEPHRPGHRVRLLLLPRRLRAARRRLRDHHDQLQSRDGVDRLRHLGPALFRAAHRRGRARDHRHRAGERHACTA